MRVSPFVVSDKDSVDKKQHEAVIGWVIDKMQDDILKHRENMGCVIYGFAVKSISAKDTPRWMLESNSGGIDSLKPLLLLQMMANLTETEKKSGITFMRHLPWKRWLGLKVMAWLASQ